MLSGASCPDGKLFLSIVPGSSWVAENGVYILRGCPAGYELITETQECSLCPAFAFCSGGSSAHIPCPGGMFSQPGSNSSQACVQVVFVLISIFFPISINDFSSSDEYDLRIGLSQVSGVQSGCVVLYSISSSGFGTTRLVSQVATSNANIAENIRMRLLTVLQSSLPSSLGKLPYTSLGSVTVTSCNPGFELIVGADSLTGTDGECKLCPASYFCPGSSNERVPCPTGFFSAAGSNSSSSCVYSVVVTVTITILIPAANFTGSVEQSFILAVASTAGTSPDKILILSVDQGTSRRLAAVSSKVEFQVITADAGSAAAVCNSFQGTSLESNLLRSGLPSGVVDSVTSSSSLPQSENFPQWILALLIVAGLVLLFTATCGTMWILRSYQKKESEEERVLEQKIGQIREDLQIRIKDGYFLGSERPSFWNRKREMVLLRRSHLEAAARLALSQEYDVHLFDAFCLSLEGEGSPTNKYPALRKWLLDISVALIRPDSDNSTNLTSLGSADPSSSGYASDRFRYFTRRVSKARVWQDDEDLFLELKQKAQEFMDELAVHCDLRYQELGEEPMGFQLVNLKHLNEIDKVFEGPDPSGAGIQNTAQVFQGDNEVSNRDEFFQSYKLPRCESSGSIRRQDHPEVRLSILQKEYCKFFNK